MPSSDRRALRLPFSRGGNLARFAFIAALAAALPASAQPPTTVIPGDGIAAEQIGRTLLQPKFCGTPAPNGYACALLYYEDAKGRDALVSKTQISRPYYQAVIAATPAKKKDDPVELIVLSAQGCPVHTTAKAVQLVSVIDAKKRAQHAIVRSIVGYQDNQSRPVGDPRKLDRARFAFTRLPDTACLVPKDS